MVTHKQRSYLLRVIQNHCRSTHQNPTHADIVRQIHMDGEQWWQTDRRATEILGERTGYITQDSAGGYFLTPAGEEALADYTKHRRFYQKALS